jgi:hypothetical protein
MAPIVDLLNDDTDFTHFVQSNQPVKHDFLQEITLPTVSSSTVTFDPFGPSEDFQQATLTSDVLPVKSVPNPVLLPAQPVNVGQPGMRHDLLIDLNILVGHLVISARPTRYLIE